MDYTTVERGRLIWPVRLVMMSIPIFGYWLFRSDLPALREHVATLTPQTVTMGDFAEGTVNFFGRIISLLGIPIVAAAVFLSRPNRRDMPWWFRWMVKVEHPKKIDRADAR